MNLNTDRDFIPVRIAILSVSDTRTLAEDRSGQTLVDRLESSGHILADRKMLRDERGEIADQLRAWCNDPQIDVIISTGGTGLTGPRRDGRSTPRRLRERNRCLWHGVHPDFHGENRHQRCAITRNRRRSQWHVPLRLARKHRRLQRRMG